MLSQLGERGIAAALLRPRVAVDAGLRDRRGGGARAAGPGRRGADPGRLRRRPALFATELGWPPRSSPPSARSWSGTAGRPPYALYALLAGLSFLAFLRARDEPSPRRVALGPSPLPSRCSRTTSRASSSRRRPRCCWRGRPAQPGAVCCDCAGLVAVAVALVPLVLDQRDHGGAFIADIPLPRRVAQALVEPVVGYQPPAQLIVTLLGGLLAVAGLVVALQSLPAERRQRLVCPWRSARPSCSPRSPSPSPPTTSAPRTCSPPVAAGRRRGGRSRRAAGGQGRRRDPRALRRPGDRDHRDHRRPLEVRARGLAGRDRGGGPARRGAGARAAEQGSRAARGLPRRGTRAARVAAGPRGRVRVPAARAPPDRQGLPPATAGDRGAGGFAAAERREAGSFTRVRFRAPRPVLVQGAELEAVVEDAVDRRYAVVAEGGGSGAGAAAEPFQVGPPRRLGMPQRAAVEGALERLVRRRVAGPATRPRPRRRPPRARAGRPRCRRAGARRGGRAGTRRPALAQPPGDRRPRVRGLAPEVLRRRPAPATPSAAARAEPRRRGLARRRTASRRVERGGREQQHLARARHGRRALLQHPGGEHVDRVAAEPARRGSGATRRGRRGRRAAAPAGRRRAARPSRAARPTTSWSGSAGSARPAARACPRAWRSTATAPSSSSSAWRAAKCSDAVSSQLRHEAVLPRGLDLVVELGAHAEPVQDRVGVLAARRVGDRVGQPGRGRDRDERVEVEGQRRDRRELDGPAALADRRAPARAAGAAHAPSRSPRSAPPRSPPRAAARLGRRAPSRRASRRARRPRRCARGPRPASARRRTRRRKRRRPRGRPGSADGGRPRA